jgi:hypothetical protein
VRGRYPRSVAVELDSDAPASLGSGLYRVNIGERELDAPVTFAGTDLLQVMAPVDLAPAHYDLAVSTVDGAGSLLVRAIEVVAAAPPTGTCTASLRSSKVYQPTSSWQSATASFNPGIEFALPATLEASEGNFANHCSFLQFTYQGVQQSCAYEGGADSSHVGSEPIQRTLGLTAHLIECRTGTFTGYSRCGGAAEGEIVPLAAGAPVRASTIALTVNGDDAEGRTTVELSLSGSCL